MPRAMWKGAITFRLVTVPVNLCSATEREGEVRFRLIHKAAGRRAAQAAAAPSIGLGERAPHPPSI
jgi:non-homologous end joining protein Ku